MYGFLWYGDVMDTKEMLSDNIDIKVAEYDVVEMEFPEYREEFPPIGIITSEKPFSLHKAEVYGRNTEIALAEQRKAERAAENFANKTEYEDLCRKADNIMEQADDVQKFAENIPLEMLMNLMSDPSREAEKFGSEPSLEKKIMKAVVSAAVILLLLLFGYIAGL